MSFFLGAGMLFAAFLVVRIGRLWIRRSDGVAEAFGWAEAISLLFTGLAAMGVASLIAATLSGSFPEVLAELAVTLGVLVGACMGVQMALRRLSGREAVLTDPLTPLAADARNRQTPGPRPTRPAGTKMRRAA